MSNRTLRSLILLISFLLTLSTISLAADKTSIPRKNKSVKHQQLRKHKKVTIKSNAVCELHLTDSNQEQGANATVSTQRSGNGAGGTQTDGTKRCHNRGKKNNKKSNFCPCWGKGDPKLDPDKCPPPPGEDKKCNNHCHTDMCDCRIKCQT